MVFGGADVGGEGSAPEVSRDRFEYSGVRRIGGMFEDSNNGVRGVYRGE